MTKKVGFWKWLYMNIKDIPEILRLMFVHPFSEAIFGIIGTVMTFPLTFAHPILIPIPIITMFLGLHGLYRLED